MKPTEVEYEKPKEESYTPEGGKRKFKIYEKIDTTKSLESIIEENIPNFRKPLNKKEFIENQILLDYIISQKYKNNKTIFDHNVDSNKNPGFEALSMFFKSKNVKVYYDNSINKDFYKDFMKYYKSENNFEKKIRIRLNLEENILKDKEKIESIVNKIINKVSEITDVKNEELHVTNVRKNCLLLDIFRSISNYVIGKFNERRFNSHKEEFKKFLKEIVNVNNGNNISFQNENGEDEDNIVVIDIKKILSNYVTNEDFTPEKFDCKYDKAKGSFGRYLLFGHHNSINKNGYTHNYPNKNCEGYGLKVNKIIDGENIFKSRNWCTIYTNIIKNKAYDSIDKFSGEYIEKKNTDKTVTKFRLFFQCKAQIDRISRALDDIIIYDDDYFVPYRLIKENLG